MEQFGSVVGAILVITVPFFAYACGRLASEKGYNGFYAGAAGLFFGMFALIFYCGLPDRRRPF